MKIIIIGAGSLGQAIAEKVLSVEPSAEICFPDQPEEAAFIGSFAKIADNFGVSRERLEEAVLQLSKIDLPKTKPFYQHKSKYHN